MAALADVTDKQHLKKTTMQVKYVGRKTEIKEYVFHWKICNFNNLKKNVEYVNKSDKLKCSFTIVKKSSLYEVTIYVDNYEENIKCSVLYEDYVWTPSVIANRTDGDVYKVNFQNSVINSPSNLHLMLNNTVVLIFKLNRSEMKTIRIQPKEIKDVCPDFMKVNIKMLQRASKCLCPDFVIRGKEESFEVHKAILAARSTYFEKYIQNNCKDGEVGEINLDVTSGAMYSFLSFMYTGRICFSTRESYAELCDLLYWLGMLKTKIQSKMSRQNKRACTANISK